ncbi:MAG: undecaprenyl-diphosphate phosphatase [Longispora sp.]|nr:undecaprenyl-diphosphate phosphatase [Longispora sp. (in: high G+C Gram-positive bacteria)]
MEIWQAAILGIIEGITEFLPISSTGHMTIAEKAMKLPLDDPGVTAFTAVVQIGAIFAAIWYFRKDIIRLATGVVRGVFDKEQRGFDYKFGWYVVAGSIPIGITGLLGKEIIIGPLRTLWFVAGALIVWSAVMWFAERAGPQQRGEKDVTLKDVLIIGVAQCLALVPGVSRSGATIATGLLRDFDRVTATRMSFFLGIPALTAAGIYELPDALDGDIGVGPILVGLLMSFIVGYASIAWLLRFVAKHSIAVFIGYRLLLGGGLLLLLTAGVITAT